MAREGGDIVASLKLPELHRLIGPARGEHSPVRAEGDARDRVGMAAQDSKILARFDIPQVDGEIRGTGREDLAVRAESDAEHAVGMAVKAGEGLVCRGLP